MKKNREHSASPHAELPIHIKSVRHESLMAIWWTSQLLRKASRNLFRNELSSESQFNVLVLLKDSPEPLTQKSLSEMLLVDKSNITGLVDRLEKLGLLWRERLEHDRRTHHIHLTDAGRKLIDELDQRYIESVLQVMQSMTGDECRTLLALTRKVRIGLDRFDPKL